VKLAIMQPYFFPYIGYWQLINTVDLFVIYDDVNYKKGGWINRNRILINGEPSYITVPINKSSSYKRICDTSLQLTLFWREKLVKMVWTTYQKAPYFKEIFPIIENLIRYETDNLADYLAYQLKTLARYMGISTQFVLSSRHYENSNLTGQNRVVDICCQENATVYINLQGGLSLYSKDAFSLHGIELKFIIPTAICYKQFRTETVPWLSIIDVMMFNSQSQINLLLNKFELV
jgi:WbqC-like protein family